MSIPLQFCRSCGTAQHPARDACRACLSDALEVRVTPVTGTLLSEAVIYHSLDPAMVANGPLRLGAIASPLGIRILALLAPCLSAGMAVELTPCPDRPGTIIARAPQQA